MSSSKPSAPLEKPGIGKQAIAPATPTHRTPDRGRKLSDAIHRLAKLGETHQLGGTGQPVGIVLIYQGEAFLSASWGGNPEDRMKSLIDAAASEGLKKDAK
ncbi:hypothetical protein QEH44_gp53 [Arthrobacter phage Shambre1]|uniref:Uncharacterized protein n=1 Tax=Arthrobacter phage Shambre1 TaxID=2927284 RepID=A0A977KNM2_9CAUD|nr:hypothetical protein QEH44_gp53 [Arthrobacter phage Shambre1]UXE04789.1 hypothetical protein SEA_SHAMBRE1_53 [Arthrobacter phage Shambre1]